MVDTADLESAALKSVEVRVFFWALDTAGNVRWYQITPLKPINDAQTEGSLRN